jgi:di/tricarboxylate transporter
MAAIEPSLQMWLTLGLVGVVIVLYVSEWISLELTSLTVLASLLVLFHFFPTPLLTASGGGGEAEDTLNAARLLAGFANPALITVLALLVVGEGLVRTGALDALAAFAAHPRLGRFAGLALILVGVAALSGFLNNTPVVVIFIPIVQAMAKQLGTPNSRVMMPLSFAAILGGMTTLIGSSTNLLVSNTLDAMGLPRLGFFEFTSLGVFLAVVGFVYLLLFLPKLLPNRGSLTGAVTRHGQQFISQIVVPRDSILIGQQARAGHFRDLPDVTIRMIQREEHAELPPFDGFSLQAGDILIIAAPRAALADVSTRHPGHLHPPMLHASDVVENRLRWTPGEADEKADEQAMLIEAMVTPSSRMVGLTLEQVGFHQRYGCLCVGILRRARMLRARMTEIRLEAGDVLLVQGRPKNIGVLRAERDLVVMSGTADVLPRRDKAAAAASIFIGAIGLAALGILPIVVASLLAATVMVAMRALSLRQAARAVDSKIFLVVAASLALGEAMFHTGGALYVSHTLLGLLDGATPQMVLSGFFLLVALFTNVLSNNACAVLFTPIGLSMGVELGVDPRIFAIAVVMAANCSFASPVGYKTNLLVMGPGQYSFVDFARAGLPLVLLLWLTFTIISPLFFAL